MIYPVVQELAADGVPVAVTCRVLDVSTSGYYEWRKRPASDRAWQQAHLMESIRQVHQASYGTYGHRRVHAELVLGEGVQVSHGRVERLMRHTGLQGVHRRRLRGCTRRDQAATPSADLVERRFNPTEPDRLYVADVTQHRTGEGWFYLAVVIDCFSRRVVGWSMADHIRSELVVDALQMAIWNRRPPAGAVHHSDYGSVGEINRSSQHLDHGGVRRWQRQTGARRPATYLRVFAGSGALTGRCGQLCARPGVRIRPGWCSGSSGG
jgi:putative transposase